MIVLKKLKIKNFAVVSKTEIDFQSGLSAVTGETGTGKSLLVGAISLLLGERGRSEYVRTGSKRALIEGEFCGDFSHFKDILENEEITFENDTLTLTRELTPDGRSRCFVNDQRVSVNVLKQIGARICDLHGQHQHQYLLDRSRHLAFLDRFAGCVPVYNAYSANYNRFKELTAEITDLQNKIKAEKEKRELYHYQLNEINSASISPDEETTLEREQHELENVTKIKERLHLSKLTLDSDNGAMEQISDVISNLSNIANDSLAIAPLLKELDSVRISLVETNRTLAEQLSRLEENPARLEEIGERLAEIYKLKRKYGGTIAAVIAYRDQISEFLAGGENQQFEIERLQGELKTTIADLVNNAGKLQKARESAARRLSTKMEQQLKKLGMDHAQFVVEFTENTQSETVEYQGKNYALSPVGLRSGQFLFTANVGEELKPLSGIASGGEISRLMLALKSLITGKDEVDILVFDEIDSGIGGNTALLVGRTLKQLSSNQQVIVITHLQQIASCAQNHYRAIKGEAGGRTESRLQLLTAEERIEELGRMISGDKFSDTERKQAEKLLAQAGGESSFEGD